MPEPDVIVVGAGRGGIPAAHWGIPAPTGRSGGRTPRPVIALRQAPGGACPPGTVPSPAREVDETMAGNPLEHLGDVDEIRIGFKRPDGSSGSTPVWVVQVGEDIYVRSMNGPSGGWYRRLRAIPAGEVRDDGHVHPVHAKPVADPATVDAVTRAYENKYGGSPYVRPLLGRDAAGATLRLDPASR
jgi:hypothetical protein